MWNKKALSRWVTLFCGMACVASGIAMATQAGIGTTPLSSVPYSLTFVTPYSFGELTIAMNIIFFFVQWALLGSRFKLRLNLLQVPLVLVFGFFIDAAMWVLSFVAPEAYGARLVQNTAGSALLALGIVLEVASYTTSLPGDGVVIAASMAFHKPFPRVKFVYDWTLVLIAAAIGLIFLGHPEGIREGTVLSAITTGLFAKLWQKFPPLRRLRESNG